MKILPAEYQDLQEILDLQYLAYQSEAVEGYVIQPLSQTLSEVQEEYTRGPILKAVDKDNKIIGSIRARQENGYVYLGKLMVHPNYQNQGIGKALLKAMQDNFPNSVFELFTGADSHKNINIYQKLGFYITATHKINDKLVIVRMRKESSEL